MKPSVYIVAALLIHAPCSAYSEAPDVNDCKRITKDAKRLACYDELFGREASNEAVARNPPTSPVTDIETRLIGDFTGWSGRTVFTLDNGEVWQQTKNYISDYSPRSPIPQPKVTITKGMFGAYNMRIEGIKRTVQVKRVQ